MPKSKPPPLKIAAAKVDAWRLARQRLLGPGAATPEEVATELIGVQAQVVSAANLSIALRLKRGTVAAAAKAVNDRRLIRSWAMRGTLHLFAADDFPVIVAALRRRENWRSPVWLRYFKVTEAQMELIIEAIGEVLGDGRPRTRKELADALVERLGHDVEEQLRSSWGTFLKPAANRGLLAQAPTDGPTVSYVRPDRFLGAWRTVETDSAFRELIVRYLAVYGPASGHEILRWWGGQLQSHIKPALTDLRDEITEVEVDSMRGLVRNVDVAAIEATPPLRGAVQLLGHFDPLTIGGGSRERLIPAAHLKRVSRTAGWISPVVLIDGVVGGVWNSVRSGHRLELTIDLFDRPSRDLKRRAAAAAEQIGLAQGQAVSLRFGPVLGSAANGLTEAQDSEAQIES